MSGRDIGGTGDPQTWGGREPYQEEDEPAQDTRDGSEKDDFQVDL
jgi:hypothetical protein